jgi:enterochelin esterase-like enzyme
MAQEPRLGPLRFRITLAREAAASPVSGRLLVFMGPPAETLPSGWVGNAWVAAREIESLAPGETVDLVPEEHAYPEPFSRAKPGAYHFVAFLDRDHSFARTGPDDDDLMSAEVKVDALDPANAAPVALALSQPGPSRFHPAETDSIQMAEFQSPLLTAFWGRPITMRASVVLPASYAASQDRRYPAVYLIHGFGIDYRYGWNLGPQLLNEMSQGKYAEMVFVFLDGSCPTGHHEFADSVNNGPWGRALVEEFIPYLERQYRLMARPSARFLTGHSSGGWSSLWLQITYPDFFGGTWSTAPDPVDFRDFTGFDATPGSGQNAYRTSDGKPRNLIRRQGRDLVSFDELARKEEVFGDYGGQIASFEWVFSPRGEGGRPMQLFNRQTGAIDPTVARAWQRYDIRLKLATSWESLGPKLKGKLHIIVGSEDSFHLEGAVRLLCDFLKQKGSDAVCEIVPDRDHGNLYGPYQTYPDGLSVRIGREMAAKFAAENR